MDGVAQRAIEALVSDAFPDHDILGEETVAPGQAAAAAALGDILGSSDWLWIIGKATEKLFFVRTHEYRLFPKKMTDFRCKIR